MLGRSARCCRPRRSSMPPTAPAIPTAPRAPAEIAARVPALLGRLAERYDPRADRHRLQHRLDDRARSRCAPRSTCRSSARCPAIKPAAALSKTRAIGVLGTDATVVQPYVDRLAAEFAADCTVIRHGSAELVELAEAKLRGEPTDPAAYRAHPRRPARPARRRADRHDRPRLHPFPAGRGRARRRRAAPARLRRRQGGDRPAHRLADPRPCAGRTSPAKASPSSPAGAGRRGLSRRPRRLRPDPDRDALRRAPYCDSFALALQGRIPLLSGESTGEEALDYQRIFARGDRPAACRRPLSRLHRHPAQQGQPSPTRAASPAITARSRSPSGARTTISPWASIPR